MRWSFAPTASRPPTPSRCCASRTAARHELNRLDIKNRTPLAADAEDQLIAHLRGLLPRVHGVIIADQVQEADCGVITERVRDELSALAQAYPTVAFLADSRVRIGLFEDVILKPNAREAASAVQPDFNGEPDRTVAEAAAAALYAKTGQPVFLTLGGDGIMAFHADGPTHIPAVPVTGPIDIVGAGDATMAGICSALCAGATVARGRADRLPGRRGDDPADRDDGDRVAGADRGVLRGRGKRFMI